MPDANPLRDLRLSETIDLDERARRVRDELIPELEERIEAAAAGEPKHEDDDAAELRDLKETLEGQARACDRVVEALNGSEFVIKELMASQAAQLQDDVTEESVDVNFETQQASGSPKQGYHRIRMVQLALWDAPSGMPTVTDPKSGNEVYAVGDLPNLVLDYIYDCAVSLNDTGEVDAGNLSDYGVASTTA